MSRVEPLADEPQHLRLPPAEGAEASRACPPARAERAHQRRSRIEVAYRAERLELVPG